MTELPLLQFCDAQMRLITRLVFDGERESNSPGVHTRMDLLIPELIAVCDSGQEALEALQNAYFFRRIKKPYPIAAVAREFLPNTISLLERLRRHYHQKSKESPLPARLDEFDRAVNGFRNSAVDFLLKWPWLESLQGGKPEPDPILENTEDAREALNELLHQARERAEGENRLVEHTDTSTQ